MSERPFEPINTRQRNNAYENQFLDWIRLQPTLDSKKHGFRCYDADGIIWNYNTKKLMLIESKTHGRKIADMRAHQKWTLEVVARSMQLSTEFTFVGLYLLTFENNSPADGGTIITHFDGQIWKEFPSVLDAGRLCFWFNYMLKK